MKKKYHNILLVVQILSWFKFCFKKMRKKKNCKQNTIDDNNVLNVHKDNCLHQNIYFNTDSSLRSTGQVNFSKM